ncbi:run and fyve domain-containing protein 2-like [Plakobranchus ocellatus]|uniref:Run and fyve domain-containing protein 2-like n=1 Tax=Plakobranchus ocellatus TaxID=259542 RepID=A0AAV4D464_9GAST|nr:run and fyve domain-containing protein 2-like [Plakobranchus ocellatus]
MTKEGYIHSEAVGNASSCNSLAVGNDDDDDDDDDDRSALETSLQIEKEWRTNLQASCEQEREKLMQTQMEVAQLKHLKKDYSELIAKHEELTVTCKEQESALAELGSHLSESKLKVEDMREAAATHREAQWASDETATHCKQCSTEFSLARRKHHCRNCGDIFCHECSDNKMPLPSSSKPVRVCDTCHTHLLQRYSASS